MGKKLISILLAAVLLINCSGCSIGKQRYGCLSEVHGAAAFAAIHPIVSPEVTFCDGMGVQINGKTVQSYLQNGVSYCTAEQLSEALPQLSWMVEKQRGRIVLQNGTCRMEVPYHTYYGRSSCGESALLFEKNLYIPIRSLAQLNNIEMLEDPTDGMLYFVDEIDRTQILPDIRVPILMYHCISDDIVGERPLYTSPNAFRQHMEYLLKAGYTPIHFSELTHLQDYEKPIIITLDDGYADNYTNMYPIIRELGIPVTIFMITKLFDRPLYLSREQAREMSDSGLVSIQSHTENHTLLSEASEAVQEQEMLRSKLEITRATGQIPYVLSYPHGMFDKATQELADQYYELAVRTGNHLYKTGSRYFGMYRLSMLRGMTVSDLKAKLKD